MTITAKYAGICSTCNQPISVGDQIEYRKGEPVEHARCHQSYFEIRIGIDRIGVFAATLDDAQCKVAAEVQDGCDAEYCYDPNCSKTHYHTVNCRCADCCSADEEEEEYA